MTFLESGLYQSDIAPARPADTGRAGGRKGGQAEKAIASRRKALAFFGNPGHCRDIGRQVIHADISGKTGRQAEKEKADIVKYKPPVLLHFLELSAEYLQVDQVFPFERQQRGKIPVSHAKPDQSRVLPAAAVRQFFSARSRICLRSSLNSLVRSRISTSKSETMEAPELIRISSCLSVIPTTP